MTIALLVVLLLPAAPSIPAPEPARGPALYADDQAALTTLVTGVVRDPGGAVVPGAEIIVRTASGAEQRGVSGTDGRFSLPVTATGELTLIVRARGFADARETLAPGAPRQDLTVDLAPASITDAITVTPSRSEQRIRDVPASVNVIGREDIRQSPATVADDLLRQLPTFSLFRRSSSIALHPTSQGVSLRGIGPSGVSRTLVLLDGVPFNDPFGGWVYWSRVPLESADRIEVVDNSSSSLYGNYAMGGVINIVTQPATRRRLDLKTQYGNLSSPKLDVSASDVFGKLGVSVDGAVFSTDGYPIVAPGERGPIDNEANVDFRNVSVKLDYAASEQVRAFFRAGYFNEQRDNGKISTFDPRTEEQNDTTWTSFSGGVRVRLADSSDLQATLFGDDETFNSNFLAVSGTPPRSIGRISLLQRVPTNAVGGLVQWSKALTAQHALTGGLDWRWVDGDSVEDVTDAATGTSVTLHRVSGGTQRTIGAYVQDMFTPMSRLVLTLSVRVDAWKNYDAHNLETSVPSGAPGAGNLPSIDSRSDTVASPRAAALYRVNSRVNVWGDFGTGFRAPTLNELYRQFRVGVRLTLPNHQLGPERLKGGEFGVNLVPVDNLTWRTTWFENRVRNPVSPVQTGMQGTTILIQRQNLGRTRIRGLQTDAEYRIGNTWSISAGYMFNEAKVVEFSGPSTAPSLVGKYLAQVPRHRGSFEVAYTDPRVANVAVMVHASGRQFDDELNVATVAGRTEPGLPAYGVVSLSASRQLSRNLEVFFGAQNLFDQQYFVGTGPSLVGSPRMVNAGVRVHLGGR